MESFPNKGNENVNRLLAVKWLYLYDNEMNLFHRRPSLLPD